MAGRAAEILPPGKTRRFQVRRNGVGIALRDGVDGADALERFYANWAARGGDQSFGPLVIEGGGTHYASGRVEVTLVRGTPSRASGTTFETRLEAVAVSEQTPLPTWAPIATFSTPTPAQSARLAEARRARAETLRARAVLDVEEWPCELCGHRHYPGRRCGHNGCECRA